MQGDYLQRQGRDTLVASVNMLRTAASACLDAADSRAAIANED